MLQLLLVDICFCMTSILSTVSLLMFLVLCGTQEPGVSLQTILVLHEQTLPPHWRVHSHLSLVSIWTPSILMSALGARILQQRWLWRLCWLFLDFLLNELIRTSLEQKCIHVDAPMLRAACAAFPVSCSACTTCWYINIVYKAHSACGGARPFAKF